MTKQPDELTVKIRMEKRGDGGYRIYAVEPTGLYVSSRSSYAAAEYFQNLVVTVAAASLGPEKDPKKEKIIELISDVDWWETAQKGEGAFVFRFANKEDIPDLLEPTENETGGDFPPAIGESAELAEQSLRVRRCEIGSKTILIVEDHGETDPVLEEIIRRQESRQ